MQASVTYTHRATASLATLAVLFAVLTVLLDAVFHVSLRLPGHRALPGALALILFAEVVPSAALLAFAVAIPVVLAAAGSGGWAMIAPWLGLALLLVGLRDAGWRRATWFLVVAGALFGALRVGILTFEVHRTPELVRWGGHLAFGALGGALAAGLQRVHRTREQAK